MNYYPNKKRISGFSLVSYSLLGFCLAFIGLPIYIYLPNYYNSNFDLSYKTISLVLLLSRLFDTVQDPIIGIVSDRYNFYRKKIIVFLCPFLALFLFLLYYPINVVDVAVWMLLTLIATYTIFSIIYINYQSYAVSFSQDYHTKTRIISCREFTFTLGVICAAIFPGVLFMFYNEVTAFIIISLFFAIVIFVFSVIFYYKVPEIENNAVSITRFSEIFKFDIMIWYFLIFFLSALSSSIPAVLIIFFVKKVIQAYNMLALFFALYFFGLLFGIALWTKLSSVLNDKAKTWFASMVFTSFAFIWCIALGEGDEILYGIICFISGLGFGGDLLLAYSILTDLIQKHKLNNAESKLFGISNFLIKMSLTLSSSILIYFIGVLESNENLLGTYISISYAGLPVFFKIIAVIILYRKFVLISKKQVRI